MSKFELFEDDKLEIKDLKKNTHINTVNIMDFIPNNPKNKKEQIGIHLPSVYVDKLKTIAEANNLSMSKLFENLLSNLLEPVEVDKKLVNQYNARNKNKGRRIK